MDGDEKLDNLVDLLGQDVIPCLQPMEVYIDDEAKLTLHGLRQHYVKLKDSEKNRKLFELLDVLEFNQVTSLNFLYSVFCSMMNCNWLNQ